MKYYVIEIATGDSKIAGKSIYEYKTKNEALASFHKKLGVAMASDLYTSEQIFVISSDNFIIAMEKYVAEPKVEVKE